MDVTLGDSVLSLNEQIKEALGLTRDAASIKLVELLYNDRRRTFAPNLRRTILDYSGLDIDNGVLEIPPVIELTVELEEE